MIDIKKQKLGLIGAGCALIGFGCGHISKKYSDLARVEGDTMHIALTHPGMFRKVGFTDCQTRIINEINMAQSSIFVQAYSFTSVEIATALCRAAKRGVKVRVLLDKDNETKPSDAMRLVVDSAIEVKIRKISGISHNKVMILDEKTVITGSYNFTKAANERNDENLLIIRNESVAKKYLKHWFICYEESHNLGEVSQRSSRPWQSRFYKTKGKADKVAKQSRVKLSLSELKARGNEKKGGKKRWGNKRKNKKLGRNRKNADRAEVINFQDRTEPMNFQSKRILWLSVPVLGEMSKDMLNAIYSAANRGVDVRIICDQDKLKDKDNSLLEQLNSRKVKVKFAKLKDRLVVQDDTALAVTGPRQSRKNSRYPTKHAFNKGSQVEAAKAKEIFGNVWQDSKEIGPEQHSGQLINIGK